MAAPASDMILSFFSIVGLLASRFSPTMERAADSAARPSMERLWRPGIERLLNARVIARSVICGSEGLTVAPQGIAAMRSPMRILLAVLLALVCVPRSEEHTSELQSLMRISYAVFCLKKKILH